MNRMWVKLSLAFTAVIMITMITIGGVVRYALETNPSYQEEVPEPVKDFFRDRYNYDPPINSTTFLLIVSTVAIIAGVGMSRSMTKPLRELEETVESFGPHNLNERVQIRGTEEIRAVATRFNEMADRLEQDEKLRRNLLADVAHELRNPLHVIKGNLQAILDDVYPLNKEEIVRLSDQTRLLTTLVDDLYDLSQAEAHQMVLHKQMVDMADLVKETAVSFKPVAATQKVKLQVELLGATPYANVDSGRMRQAVANLLTNALRHTPESGEIWVTVEQRGETLYIIVRDSGSGIEAEHLPYVFERFYRTDSARSRGKGGTGLGLAITKAIVEAHDGEINAGSLEQGQGAVFEIKLPNKYRPV
jgi:two-component system sensor histidine kinase BaeS